MGLGLSVIISYAGVNNAIECLKHILNGVVSEKEPDFRDLIEYYTQLLNKSENPSSLPDWTKECGQGYLSLTEDENGNLKSAAVKFYDPTHSTAILFSTKISSFGQESVEDITPHVNGDYRSQRYTPTRTKTIISNTSESFSVGYRNRSPSPRESSVEPKSLIENSSVRGEYEEQDKHHEREKPKPGDDSEAEQKLTWLYSPRSPTPQPLPEIHFQSYDDDDSKGVYTEDVLRSLDGLKYRPLQRSDPSGRRRSFKKRRSSSSTSSKDSRASREEELKMFTSLEEAEFERMNKNDNSSGFGSAPNIAARSHSRSRSRESSKERKQDSWSVEASADSLEDDGNELKPRLKDLPKLDSFEEEKEDAKGKEVTEDDEEIDFWGNMGD